MEGGPIAVGLDCSWCGAEIFRGFASEASGSREWFCSRSHRDASTRALRRLRNRIEGPDADRFDLLAPDQAGE